MPLEDRHIWKKPRGPTWFRKIIDDIYVEITEVQPLGGINSVVSQTTNGRQVDFQGGAGGGGAGGTDNNHYEFEAIDFSDDEGAKVLIYDGFVYGPNDDGNYPDGMTGVDDFVAGPFTTDVEVWLEIWVDFDSWDVTSININWGDSTPEDNDTTIFVTICFVGIDWTTGDPIRSFTKDISNAICGDYVINPGLGVLGADDTGTEVDIDHVNQINFLGACTVEHDPTDLNPNSVDINIGPDLEFDDDTGVQQAVDKVEVIGFWGAVSGTQDTTDPDVIDVDLYFGEDLTGDDGFGGAVTIDKCEVMNFIGAVRLQEDTSDPDVTAANIICGMFIDDGGGIDEYDDIWGLRFPDATLTLIEPGYLKVEIAGTLTVESDDLAGGSIGNINKLGFWGAVDAVQDTGDPHDIDLTFGLDLEGTNDVGADIAIDKVMVLGLWGACTLSQDISDPDVIDVDVTFGEDITGDDGLGGVTSVDKVEVMNFTGAVRVQDTSTVDTKSVDIIAGMFISDGTGEDFDDIWGLTFEGAQLTLLEPGHLEVGGLDPVFDVQGSDGSYVASVGLITFKVAADPSANYITVYNGPGSPGVNEAVVEVPLIPASIGGFTVLADDGGDTHWQATQTCECSSGGVDGGGP